MRSLVHRSAYPLLVLAASTASSRAATQEPRADTAVFSRIRAEAYNRSRVLETATMLSDGLGPRLAGSAGYRAAAAWARDRLAGWGVRATLEPWGRRRAGSWEVERARVEMTTPRYLNVQAYPKAWSPPTAGVVAGTPLLVTVRADSDFVRYRGKLRGRIVMNGAIELPDTVARFAPMARRLTQAELDSLARLTDAGEPRTYWEDYGPWVEALGQRQRIAEFFQREGVAAVLEPSRNPNAVLVASYNAYLADPSGYPPAFVLAREQYNRIARLLGSNQPVRLELELRTRVTPDDSTGYNLVAEIPGTDPRLKAEVVMLGGHFDSWNAGTGATDNAAGSAAAMEAMRILGTLGVRPRRTIRLVLWDGEEQEDYFGSMGYVRRRFGEAETMKLLPEQARISAYYNYDTGTGRVRAVALQNNAAARPIVQRFLAPVCDLGACTVTLANQGSTDVMPLSAIGIPAFNLVQDPIDYDTRTHHTQLDVADYLLENDLKQAATVIATLVYETAMRDERMPRPALPAPRPKM